jgi:two-component system phosphate regulon sensor histidine kinase PhoR
VRGDLALRGTAVAAACAAAGFAFARLLGAAPAGSVIALAVVLSVLAGGLLGWFAFRRPAAALRTVADAAGQIGEGELARRVPEASGPAGELTHAFNVMGGRIEQLFDSVAAEHARLEAVFDASSDAMVALSSDTRVQFMNPAAVEVLGRPMSEAIGRSFIETTRDYELDALVRRVLRDREHGQTSVVTFGAARIPLRAAALPIRDGGEWAVLVMLTDLTEVQRVDQVRRDFLSNVSHELRTPLAAIRALVETLEDGVDGEDSPEFLRRINQQVARLTTLVNELLDLSRIESGAINLNPEPVELSALVAETVSLRQPRTEAANVTVAYESGAISLEADRPSLLRIVTNLLDNAAKWSPPGGTVHVTAEDDGDLVALTVRDEGPGIPEQDLSRVFERFYKGEASRAGAGVGLGLAIVKHLVRAHGGTATVESRPGEGARFTVALPKRFVGRRGG